jgi:RNase P subunit RPR2
MSNVIEGRFQQKRPTEVWTCNNCDGQHFYLNADGTVQCRGCQRIMERIEWIYREKTE